MNVLPQCSYTSLQLRYFPILLIKIKGIQKADHKIKIVNFPDSTTISIKDTTSLNVIQAILKLYEHVSM